MALNIKSERADRLARELAKEAGETITEAVTEALAQRLERLRRQRSRPGRRAELRRIQERVSRLPELNDRSDDDLLDYGPDGTFEP